MRLLLSLVLSFPAFAQTGKVEGVVLNGVTGAEVSGATVSLRQTPGTPYHYEAVTDSAGAFLFTGVNQGEYRTLVEKTGFTTPPSRTFPPPPVRVGADSETNPIRLRFELLPPATLRGHVFGIDGKPAAGVKVDLGGGKMGKTAQDGSYLLDQVEPGVYTLVARLSGTSARLMQDGVRMEIVPTYFPSVVDRSLAEQIAVRPGADRSGYDIRLQTAAVYRVRGVVLDPESKPVPKAVVELLNRNSNGELGGFITYPFGPFSIRSGAASLAYELAEPAVTGPDGKFEFPSVRTGEWLLSAESGDLPARYGVQSLGVGRSDVDDLPIRLLAPFDVSVSSELSDHSPTPGLAAGVTLIPEDGIRGTAGTRGPDWPWIKNVTPGRYRIRASSMMLSPEYYVASILLGDSNVTGQVVDLSASSPPIRIVMRTAGTIRGTVEKGENAVVVLWPQRLVGGDIGMSAVCRSGGNFEIRGLAPGDYYAVALDRFDPSEMADALHLSAFASRAVPVRVEEGSTLTLPLSLTLVTDL